MKWKDYIILLGIMTFIWVFFIILVIIIFLYIVPLAPRTFQLEIGTIMLQFPEILTIGMQFFLAGLILFMWLYIWYKITTIYFYRTLKNNEKSVDSPADSEQDSGKKL